MLRDLGPANDEVHAAAEDVLSFWFGLPAKKRFAKDEALDAEIARRFGMLRDRLLATEAAGWRDQPDPLLAATIALDQFSRNIARGSPRAYAGDALALSLARDAIGRGWDGHYPAEHRAFLYMPLMHAEDADAQAESVDRFTALGDAEQLRYAREHAAVIDRYGRFPSRNAALGRASTADEEAYLSRPDAGW